MSHNDNIPERSARRHRPALWAIGTAIGALIYGMTNLGITYAGWNPDWLKTFLCIMLVLATLVNTYVRRQAEKR